jgi:3-deoxy-D-manno-octulosonic-acid transferase
VTERLPATLRSYRFLTRAVAPLAPLLLSYRQRHGKEDLARMQERRGMATVRRPHGPLVWMHGASVGELLAILPLIERIQSREFTVLVTSGTVTSAGIAERRLPPDVIHQFVPLDVPQFVERFLDTWKPNLALFVESDLWPNLILRSAARRIPLILLNGRLSERSFDRWKRAPRTIGALLRRFDLCLAQSAADAARYAGLGAPRISTTGNLKLDAPAPPADDEQLRALLHATAGRPVIAAASTHPGEEAMVVDAHRKLRHSFPGLLTVLAPRHPDRGSGVAEIVKLAGLKPALRSEGELPDRSVDVYVADTLGELGLVYRIAPIVFMGGSLVSHGGQNPIEAAKLGAAILHGPHVSNFAAIYAALDAGGGAEQVSDAGKLAVRIGAWLTDAGQRQAVADTAIHALDTMVGALDRTVAALDPYLMQFRLEGRGRDA